MSEVEPTPGKFCDLCGRLVKYGKGGEANWIGHVNSQEHQKNVKAKAKPSREITSFFTARPPPQRQPPAPPFVALPAVSIVPPVLASTALAVPADSSVIDVDAIEDSLHSRAQDILLAQLHSAISTLPSTVPLASTDDFLARFAVNPVYFLLPGVDPWEGFVHQTLSSLLLDGEQPRTTIQLSRLIRRGDFGMDGFLLWLRRCLLDVKIPFPMIEGPTRRIIRAMEFLGSTTDIEPVLVTASATPAVFSPPTIGCPGQELRFGEGKNPFLAYPLAAHTIQQLPWRVEFGQKIILHADDCLAHGQKSGVCGPCKGLLRNGNIKGFIDRDETGPQPNTPYALLPMGDLQALLHKKNKQINDLKLHGLNLSRKLLVRARHLEGHARFVLAVSQGNVPRVASIVANCLEHGDSIFTATEKIYRAAAGAFPDRSYTYIAYQQLYLFLQLGGPAAAELAHRCLGLPSINATKDHIATVPLVASAKAPTRTEMLHNLDVAFPAPLPTTPGSLPGPGFQIMVDEIKVEGRMRWDPRSNMILGLCREHTAKFELQFIGMAQAEAVHEGLLAKKIHLASEATVAAVSSFSDVPRRNIAHPFIIAPTCKQEKADEQKLILLAARDAVEERATHIGGRLYSISSDGDGKRRNAALAITFNRILDQNGSLFKKLGDLPLFDYHCGRNDITMDIDFKHLFKRFRNTLIRSAASTIDSVVLTHQLLKAHLSRDSRHDSHHINSILNPGDRQDVKAMYDLLSAIAILPEALATDSPAFCNTRRVLRLLGCLYRHVLESYTIAAMHLMMAIYKREAGKFVPSQTYFDFMTAGKNVFFKRVRGFARHNDTTSTSLTPHSDDTVPGEPMTEAGDPAAILVRSNGFVWLAVVLIAAISSGPRPVQSLPARLLAEPGTRMKVQLMELVAPSHPPAPESDEGDWEWTSKFLKCAGTSTVFEVAGAQVQLLNPAVLPATKASKIGTMTYHFKSVELVAIAAAMELRTQGHLPEVLFGSSFPYRTVGGYACFVCNKDGNSLKQQEGLCPHCPDVSLKASSHSRAYGNPHAKRKGKDGTNKIDLDHSRCPNVGNLGLAHAGTYSERRPCTNVPDYCPIPGCADVVWKYNLKSHIVKTHPTANILSYKSYCDIDPKERQGLKVISRKKPRKRSQKKTITFKISVAHSTESALSSLEDDSPHDTSDVEESENPSESEDEVSTNDASLPPVAADGAVAQENQSSAADIDTPNSTVTVSDARVDEPVVANATTLVLQVDNEETGQQEDAEMASSGQKSRRGRLLKRRKTAISSDEEIPSLLPGSEESAEPPVVLR
ncbi:hypothetical protein C8R45DRAFT_1128561 [Mycena sanguinolenta]|nr:hypothetical protein C8R45DRAFT_1128561 [Mycena sanguinolenta]